MILKLCTLAAAMLVGAILIIAQPASAQGTLRVCADPNYMPYSDRAQEGFENKIALAVARYLGDKISYTWSTQRGPGGWDEFIHDTLNAGKCDLIVNVPYASQAVLTTQPYYVSSYVFVFDKSKNYDIQSLDSPDLQRLKIGYETDTPPQDGLKVRGILSGQVPFDVAGTEGQSPAVILDAVRSGRIQVGITWEPAVGYYLKNGYSRLSVVPLPNSRQRGVPEQYIFPMSMGVRHGNEALHKQLERVVAAHQPQLVAILDQFGVKLYHPNINPY
jgi:mxaJ protein